MDIRARVQEFMGKHNEEFPAKKVYHCIKPEKIRILLLESWLSVRTAVKNMPHYTGCAIRLVIDAVIVSTMVLICSVTTPCPFAA